MDFTQTQLLRRWTSYSNGVQMAYSNEKKQLVTMPIINADL